MNGCHFDRNVESKSGRERTGREGEGKIENNARSAMAPRARLNGGKLP